MGTGYVGMPQTQPVLVVATGAVPRGVAAGNGMSTAGATAGASAPVSWARSGKRGGGGAGNVNYRGGGVVVDFTKPMEASPPVPQQPRGLSPPPEPPI